MFWQNVWGQPLPYKDVVSVGPCHASGTCRDQPYVRYTDAQNPVESRRPGWVLNVQDPIVFTAILQ